MGRLQRLLDAIEQQDGPKAAFNCIMEVAEYHIPKLARTEITGANGGPQQFQVAINFQKPGDE